MNNKKILAIAVAGFVAFTTCFSTSRLVYADETEETTVEEVKEDETTVEETKEEETTTEETTKEETTTTESTSSETTTESTTTDTTSTETTTDSTTTSDTTTNTPSAAPQYKLSVNTKHVNFPSIYEDEYADGVTVKVTNKSNVPVTIGWRKSGSDWLTIDAPNFTTVEVGQSAPFTIYVEPGAPAGSYSGSVMFYVVEDSTWAASCATDYSITIKQAHKEPVVTGVSITPSQSTIDVGKGIQLSAKVSGTDIQDNRVYWEVSENTSGGTSIDQNGYLKVDANEGASELYVYATSYQDDHVYGYAVVNLAKHYVTIAAESYPAEGGQVSGGDSYTKGSNVTLNASANNGFVFKGWYEGDKMICSTNRLDLKNVKDNKHYYAYFEKTKCYVVTSMNPSGAGAVTGSTSVNYGGSVTLTADPIDGYAFAGWKENGKILSTNSKFTLNNITEDHKITACFVQNNATLQLAVSPTGSGSVSGAGNYALGSKVTMRATPAAGYTFAGWYINGDLISSNSTFVIDGIDKDYSAIAAFIKIADTKYTIDAGVSGTGGSISPSGRGTFSKGAAMTYTITPDEGYKISMVVVDGQNVGINNKYTFTSITGNHTIIVSFEKKPVQATTTAPKTNANTVTSSTAKASTEEKAATVKKAEEDKAEKADQKAEKEPEGTVDVEITDTVPEDLNVEDVVAEDPVANVDYSALTGTLQTFNVTRDEAKAMIDNGEASELFTYAYMQGDITYTVNNDFGVSEQETSDGTVETESSVSNYQDVIKSVLTEDELLDALEGVHAGLNVDITDYTEDIPWYYKDALQYMSDKYDLVAKKYFDITMIKTVGEESETISELNGTPATIVLQLPDNLKGKDVSVVHFHHNDDDTVEKEVLLDMDDNPDTVTFSISSMSMFALATHGGFTTAHIINYVVVLIILVIILIVLLMMYRKLARRRRKKS